MLKRGPQKPIKIETDRLCDYGCGKVAQYQNKSMRYMCNTSASKCDANREKNSTGLIASYESGKHPISNFAGKQNWRKGLDISDPRIKNNADAQRGKSKNFSKPMSQTGRDNISKSRVKTILEGRYDTSGRKGHRGHYDGVYFHSSWELAFYVYIKETTNLKIERNTKYIINYLFENLIRRYVPDFILEGKLVEIKGYLHGARDLTKYDQTKNKVEYKFEKDLQNELTYCKQKYGDKFWEKLYAKDN